MSKLAKVLLNQRAADGYLAMLSVLSDREFVEGMNSRDCILEPVGSSEMIIYLIVGDLCG